jgi:chemotaxis response regulator CheB
MLPDNAPCAVLIDDDPSLGDEAEAILRQHAGLALHRCPTNQHAAWAMVMQVRPVLVLLDLGMVERFGQTFLRMMLVRHPVPVLLLVSDRLKDADLAGTLSSSGILAHLRKQIGRASCRERV